MIIAVQHKPKNKPSYYMDYEATLLSGNWPSDEDLVTIADVYGANGFYNKNYGDKRKKGFFNSRKDEIGKPIHPWGGKVEIINEHQKLVSVWVDS